jgi:hypothetical protein
MIEHTEVTTILEGVEREIPEGRIGAPFAENLYNQWLRQRLRDLTRYSRKAVEGVEMYEDLLEKITDRFPLAEENALFHIRFDDWGELSLSFQPENMAETTEIIKWILQEGGLRVSWSNLSGTTKYWSLVPRTADLEKENPSYLSIHMSPKNCRKEKTGRTIVKEEEETIIVCD